MRFQNSASSKFRIDTGKFHPWISWNKNLWIKDWDIASFSQVKVSVHSPMSKRRYKVEAAVHPVVHDVPSVQPTFIVKISFKLIVNVLDDGLETRQKTCSSLDGAKKNPMINNFVCFCCIIAQIHLKSIFPASLILIQLKTSIIMQWSFCDYFFFPCTIHLIICKMVIDRFMNF